MIGEEYSVHVCSPIPNGKIIKIDIDYYMVTKNQLGETVLMAKDFDGTSYRLTVKEKNELKDFSPTENQQRNKTTDDETEPKILINSCINDENH